ncbi:hypothetical protein PFBG_02738 [Plasmodium falciparum 7G8]|uniref:Erythrocyte membrane protein 1 n=2 Tax=Plasmodium falciparum TaxID=5833 RepID=W7FML6_PLAF8|nr:hypothetical protein PFBG_02738 [Plasmodium falciparum 7G8]
MAAASGGGGGNDYSDAKDFLDSIGKIVHDKVKEEAAGRSNGDLKGNLTDSTILGERARSNKTCDLVKEYYKHPNGGGDVSGKRYPCKELSGKMGENRFSDTLGGQCTDSKIKGNKNNCGACAPYRRLHLCHHNLETIDTKSTTHKLLAEVCMAAKYEGESLTRYHPKYQEIYSGSTMCTMLARSFADIGDIVRGRDPFYGNPQEKEKREDLEKKLKEIFKKIYDNLVMKKGKEAQERYKKDKKTGNYYQLREDWWDANRATIWEAITCHAGQNDKYFRNTCSNGGSYAYKQCRCDGANVDPPTYFDYVPQYLRWFEEWAEDFCRLRKRKLEDAIKKCRKKDNSSEERYCDLNRHDCTQTASGKHDFFEDDDCIGCHFSCARFVKWIDNQKLEFLKQKEKYETEISNSASCGGSRKKRSATIKYEGYEKEFYEQFKKKGNYGTVEGFLGLLNKEDVCTKNNGIEDGGTINFKEVNSGNNSGGDGSGTNVESQGTFYRTTYCEACPWCGVKKQKVKGKWEPEGDEECAKKIEKTYNEKDITTIPKLTPDKEKSNILDKYKTFCSTGDSQIKKWQCYYKKKNEKDDVKKDINFCVLQDGKQNRKEHKVTSYNAFFWDWVHDMLIDSMQWRDEHGKCINKDNDNTCIRGCKSKCECFQKWVVQKGKEWDEIKVHFGKQDFGNQGENAQYKMLGEGMESADFVLQEVLKKNLLLEIIQDTYGNTEETKHIEALLKETGVADGVASASGSSSGVVTGKKNIMDKLIEHEEGIATKCKNCQPTKIRNPCSGDKSGSSNTYTAVAQTVAKILQQKAHTDMLQRSCKDGDKGGGKKVSLLKGDASQGHYNGKANESVLNDVCDITNDHSNAESNKSKNPCNGKGDGLQIGDTWNVQNSKSSTFGVHIRPRRKHICTSNLEKIDDTWVIKNANDHVNDTFLGNVLLAAKKEAEDIKKKYKEIKDKNGLEGDQVTTCRAIKSSFADIGDIIRGRDLLDDKDQVTLQDHLKTIFGKIKGELKNKLCDKYKNDTDGKHTKFREDWWEANRDQVWNAMTCPTKNGNIQCGATPYDDYIPQRLRWMTEWAEWYCKEQSRLYGELLQKCGNCKDKIKGKVQGCTSSDPKCTKCKEACDKYKDEINKWEEQWNNMQVQYVILYGQAKTTSTNASRTVFPDAGPDYQQMLDFFKELQEKYKTATSGSATNSPYATPAGYIHQEARTGQCLEQNEFCEYENGVARDTDGAKENKKYAFKHPPHGYDKACKCDTRDQQTDGRARSENQEPQPAPAGGPGATESASDDDDDEEDEDEDEEVQEAAAEGSGKDATEEVGPKEEGPQVKVCKTVEEALKGDLNEACTQKYSGNNSRLGWKCVTPSGEKSGDSTTTSSEGSESAGPTRKRRAAPGESAPSSAKSDATGKSDTGGSICIPPRRRKLYIKKIQDWANKHNTDKSQVDGEAEGGVQATENGAASTSPQVALLRDAFIQSAAIETFFLWHKYKAENTKTQGGVGAAPALSPVPDSVSDEDPSNPANLQSGKIPPDFLRQMFYTLGDYRDICVGNKTMIEVLKASGDNKSSKNPMQEISEKIKEMLSEQSDTTPPKLGKPSVNDPKDWWEQHGKHIWEGMICALTYTDSEQKGDGAKPTQIQNAETLLEQLKEKYDYKIVTISSVPSGDDPLNNPKLTQFVERPPYFRYLEEWGETFCRQRTRMLGKIRGECVKNDGRCSGDGHICDKTDTSHNDTFIDLHCPGCLKECIKYKRWIDIKFVEYHKQKDKYDGELQKVITSSNNGGGDKNCCKDIEKHTSAADFLESLKHCKDGQTGGEQGNQEDKLNKINFTNIPQTFSRSTYCKACPFNGVTCNRGRRAKNGCTANNEPQNAANTEDGEPTTIPILINDGSTNGATNGTTGTTDETLKDCSEKYNFFKRLRKQEWTCQKKNGVDQCNLTNSVDNIDDSDKIIPFNVFFQRWLRNFVHDYNILKGKIKACIKKGNGKEDKCFKGCKDKCKCVEEWLDKKEVEWKKIKEHYEKNKSLYGYEIPYWVMSYFQHLYFDNDHIKAQDVIEDENEREELWGNTGRNYNNRQHTQTNDDFITNLISKLQDKITSCQNKHNPNGKTACDPFPPHSDETLDEQTDDDTTDNQSPAFCKDIQPPPPPLQQDACEIVDGILNGKSATSAIDGCNTKNYNGWTCQTDKFEKSHAGACMPPRRQKLCVHYLKQSMTNTNELKYAFIKCAAVETLHSWHYYKNKNGNEAETLESGTIPEEFKRQMFYTFADYRDICLGTDISSITDMRSAVSIAKDNIYKVFNKSYQTSIDHRKSWWETNGPEIWKGMLCALEKASGATGTLTTKYTYSKVKFSGSNSPTLETFAQRPQFLRWFTEWGEDFCKKQKKELVSLKKKCDNCTVSDSGTKDNTKMCNNKENCDECKQACDVYKNFIQTWKTHYEKQSKKYDEDKKKDQYKSLSDVTSCTQAYEYLDKQLKNMTCTNGLTNENCKYTCMNTPSSTNTGNMPKSMDDEPEDVKGKCNCVPNECNALSVSGSGIPDGQAFGGGVLDGTCKGLGEPKKKIEPPQYDPTNDILKSTIPVTIVLALGSIAFLFIKKKRKKGKSNIRTYILKQKKREILEY